MTTHGAWIWPGSPGTDLINNWAQFRYAFTIQKAPSECPIMVTADKSYRLYVNGKWVIDGPCRGFAENWFYDTVDIAPFLQAGENVIAALAHTPGISSHQYIHSGYAGFFLEGIVGNVCISSSKDWSRRSAPEFIRHQTRLSTQLGWQEFFDAQNNDGDWTNLGYDDSHWEPCSFFGARAKGSAPWHNIQERDVPLLRTELIVPKHLVSTATHTIERDWGNDTNIATALRLDVPTCTICDKNISVLDISAQENNTLQVFVFAFQREVCASILLDVIDADGGEIIDMVMLEGLKDGLPIIEELTGCTMALAHRYTCATGTQQHETFSLLGGCYLAVTVRGRSSGFQLKLQLRHHEYPFTIEGNIQAAGTRFQDIYNLCLHTQQLCASDTYVDCPGREQGMWWGDVITHFGNSTIFAADSRLLERGIKLMGQQRLPNGLTYGLAPTHAHECVLPDFTLAWIRSFWMLYHFNEDTTLAQEYQHEIMRAFEYFFEQSAETGLLPFDDRYWLFLDWADTFKDGTSTLYNIEYLETLENAYTLFTAANLHEKAHIFKERAQELRTIICTQLWNEERKEPYDGLHTDGQLVPRNSLHNLVRFILLDLHPEEHVRWAKEYILPFIAGERPRGGEIYADVERDVDTSVLTPYYLHFTFLALDKLGYSAEILSCIERWWGDMIDRGLVTTEEVWDAQPGIASTCHAWAANPVQHISYNLLGIRQKTAGWTSITVAPCFTASPSANGVVDTPHGPISIEWETEQGSTHGKLSLPDGIHADVVIGDQTQEAITGIFEW